MKGALRCGLCTFFFLNLADFLRLSAVVFGRSLGF